VPVNLSVTQSQARWVSTSPHTCLCSVSLRLHISVAARSSDKAFSSHCISYYYSLVTCFLLFLHPLFSLLLTYFNFLSFYFLALIIYYTVSVLFQYSRIYFRSLWATVSLLCTPFSLSQLISSPDLRLINQNEPEINIKTNMPARRESN